MNTLLKASLLAPFLVASVPLCAVAQEAAMRPMYELPTISIAVLDETDPLQASVSELYQQGEWAKAANIFKDAAEALPANDPESYVGFDRSARLFFYAGEFGEGRKMMEQAADVALATGDIVSAAYRYVDAAFIAVWEGYPGKRRELVKKAEELSVTPGVEEDVHWSIIALTRGVGALPVSE